MVSLRMIRLPDFKFDFVGKPKPKNRNSGKIVEGACSGDDGDEEEPKMTLKSLFALVATGAGSPFLGDFEGVDEDTGTLNFSLDANNLVDEEGNSKQTKMPYFEEGWVDEEEEERKSKKQGPWPW